MNENIVVTALFFATVIILSLGIPLVRAFSRRQDQLARSSTLSPELSIRLDRIESMIETVAVEVERLSEGQRFVNHVMSTRRPERDALPVQPPPFTTSGESSWITPH